MSSKVLAGRYELFEKIGEGGMSVVYKAKDRLLNRYVAIKVLKPEFIKDQKFIESFRRESQAAASLSHPNIVNIFDVGQEGNIHYIVMELVEGKTLSELIHETGPLPYQKVIELTKQIASALSVAHKHQIIHRDVKPHNVLITTDGTAKLTDFGIAKAINASTIVDTTGGGIMGSVHYFSPEQARGGYVDEKSDIYSLGIVMYEMLTGRVPFDGDNPVNIALMHINSEMVPPSKLIAGIPPALERIVLKATDKYQTNRFGSADDLIKALDNLEFVGSVVGDSMFMASADTQQAKSQESPIVEPDYEEDDYEEDDYEEGKSKKQLSKKKKILIAVIAAVVVLGGLGVAFAMGAFSGDPVVVPDLQGKTLQEAKAMAEEVGFEVEEGQQVNDPEIEEGCVVSQDPEANSTAKKGTTIRVNISKGPSNGEVPDVIGMTEDDAREALAAAGFKVGDVSPGESELDEGQVCEQSPEEGESAPEGSTVDLVISDGSLQKVTMPYIVGMDIDDAKATLYNAGLKPGKIKYSTSDTYDVNEVMAQQYEANEEIQKGSSVRMTVSEGPASKSVDLEIDFSDAENEVFYLTVTLTDDSGTRNIINNQQRSKSDGSETVTLEGEGSGTVVVIFDGEGVMRRSVNFTRGTIS